MHSVRHILLIAFVILLVTFGWYLYSHKEKLETYTETTSAPLRELETLDTNKMRLQMGSTEIIADVVSTEEDRERGLGGRPFLADDTGMIFVFEKPDFYTFWMKDMTFAIDMIWLSSDMKVVDIKEGVEPSTYETRQSFRPRARAQYVLEVSRGDVKKAGLKIGDTVSRIE